MRRLRLAPLAAAGIVACGAACGELLAGEPGGLPPEGDAAPEAAAVEAGNDVTTSPESGAPSTCADRVEAGTPPLFCDDFERTTAPEDGWGQVLEVAGGAVDISTQRSVSGSRSLRAQVAAGVGGKVAYLRTSALNVMPPLTIEWNMYVDLAPPFNVDSTRGFVFGNFESDFGPFNYFYSGVNPDGTLNPYLSGVDPVLTAPLGGWLHLKAQINASTIRLSVTSEPLSVDITRTLNRDQVMVSHVWLGIEVGSSGGPVTLYIDDVVIYK
jgi:hypothetical protein